MKGDLMAGSTQKQIEVSKEAKMQVPDEGNTVRSSNIRIGISRTLNTAKYESIVINYEINENISWSNYNQRLSKLQNWETVFLNEFKEAHDRILKELNLSHKKAYFVHAEEKVDQRIEPGEKHELDELADLDVLDIG